MLFKFFIPFFIIIFINFYFTNAIPLGEDKLLISFVRNDQKMQISEYSKQKYEAYLGIMYYMRKNWQCDKIGEKFKEFERTECQKYRKYLDILYEYLYRKYAEIPTVKPKFVLKKEIEIDGAIIYAVNCLTKISQFYFKSRWILSYKYKLNELLKEYWEPKLLNEERFNYEIKLPINELILQLAIDTANEWQTNESLDGIIRQNFDKKLEEMFKKHCKDDKTNDNIDLINSKFDDQLNWTEDALFSEFVKGLAKNFEKFIKMAKEYSNYLSRKKENGNIHWYYDRRMISFGFDEIEKMKEHLTQKYEARLGVVYLLRENWHCDKIVKEMNEYERIKCQKYRKYFDILYEYLFRLYVEGKSAELANKFPSIKPIFNIYYYYHVIKELIFVIESLNDILKFFWPKDKNKLKKTYFNEMDLLNEIELNYVIKEEEHLLKKINGPKNVQKNGNKVLNSSNSSNEIEDNFRQEFEQKMEKIYKKSERK